MLGRTAGARRWTASRVVVLQSPVPPQYVFWYHNARMINYDATRGVTVHTEPGPKTQSALAIRAAAPHHSGNYTCRAANTEPAHIYVYVSEGSQYRAPALIAMHLSVSVTVNVSFVAGDKMAATLSRNACPAAGGGGRAPLLAAAALLLARAVGARAALAAASALSALCSVS